jgi:hypothetical protein
MSREVKTYQSRQLHLSAVRRSDLIADPQEGGPRAPGEGAKRGGGQDRS